jgi:small GTP-binding protein
MIRESEKIFVERKNICKIVVSGDGAVGKTTLCHRLTGELKKYENRLMTCGVEFHDLKRINGTEIDAQIWDLGGQDHFRHFQEPFFKKLNIAIFVFSVEWFHSFIDIDFWLGFLDKEEPIKAYLIGNKIDSENRDVQSEEAQDFAKTRGMVYYEISALNGNGFNEFKDDLLSTIEKLLKKD